MKNEKEMKETPLEYEARLGKVERHKGRRKERKGGKKAKLNGDSNMKGNME